MSYGTGLVQYFISTGMTCVGRPSSLSCCVARSRPELLQLLPLSACLWLCVRASACDPLSARPVLLLFNVAKTMTGIAAASFFSNICQFGGCGLHFESLAELIVHIEDNHIGKCARGNRICAAAARAAMAGSRAPQSHSLPASQRRCC